MKDRLHMGKRGAVLTFIAALMIGVLALTTVACGGGTTTTITESGSTTVQPLADVLAAGFTAENPNVKVVIQGVGSSAGIKAANEGTVDIGASSRDLTASDPTLVTYLLGYDGIAIITNTGNSINGLTKQQVRDIFDGNITNWNQVGGADHQITVICREEGSGTRTSFEGVVMSGNNITKSAILQTSNGALKTAVSGTPYSIGFLSLGYMDSTVKSLTFDGVSCTAANIKNKTYPVSHPLYFLTKTQATGIVKDFIDYCTGAKGQAIVVNEGYISIQ
jgi:phosphate transport system substrate-binding protein